MCLNIIFFTEKVAEAIRNFAQLQDEIRQVDSKTVHTVAERLARRRSTVFVPPRLELETKNKSQQKKLADVKLAFSEFYLSLILLQNYQVQYMTRFLFSGNLLTRNLITQNSR